MNRVTGRSREGACLLGLCLLLAAAVPAVAQGAESGDEWQVAGQLYLWGAGVDIKSASGADIEVPFDDVLDALEMGFMGSMAARKGRWSVFGDLMYVGVDSKDNTTIPLPPSGSPADVEVQIEQDAWIVTAGGGYAFKDEEQWRLDGVFGLRYINLKTDVTLDFGPGMVVPATDKSDLWDAVVGLRGRTNLSERWYITYYGDVGAGDSDLTWQALGGINYSFGRLDVGLGYRHLEWQLDKNSLLDKLAISGPYAGIGYRFK